MVLYEELLLHLLQTQPRMEITFPDLDISPNVYIESGCYQALQKIRDILRDDSLTDNDCFSKIEAIVCLLEEMGIDTGNRHDFG